MLLFIYYYSKKYESNLQTAVNENEV